MEPSGWRIKGYVPFLMDLPRTPSLGRNVESKLLTDVVGFMIFPIGTFLVLATFVPGLFELWKVTIVAAMALVVTGWAHECAKAASIIGLAIGLVTLIALYALLLCVIIGAFVVISAPAFGANAIRRVVSWMP